MVRGPWGWRPLWQRPFSTYKSPKFYLSFTILVSLILVKYPDRIPVGLVNTVGTYSTVVQVPLVLVPACTGRPKYYYRVSETIRTEVGKGRTAAAAHESAARLSIPF